MKIELYRDKQFPLLHPESCVTARRLVFDTTTEYIGFRWEYQSKEVTGHTKDWYAHSPYYLITAHRQWAWGSDHFWYDGPHCGYHLGFISLAWQGDGSCKKCEGK